MHFLATLVPLFLLASDSLVVARGVGIAGTINNALQAASLQSIAHLLEPGSYTLKNVATGQALTYNPDGNHIAPTSSRGSPVTLSHYGGIVAWVRLAIGEKNKCLSSQWGGSYDHAAVMYDCAVAKGGRTKKGNTLEPTKQWWILVPVEGDSKNNAQKSHKIGVLTNGLLVSAQKDSVNTRNKAIKAGISRNGHPKNLNSRRHVHDAMKRKAKRGKGNGADLNAVVSVEAGARYYIIPTDHLIDMHTMALTGSVILTSGNVPSTALSSFNRSDKKQQWVITRT